MSINEEEYNLYENIAHNLAVSQYESEERYSSDLKRVEPHSRRLEIEIPQNSLDERNEIVISDSLIRIKQHNEPHAINDIKGFNVKKGRENWFKQGYANLEQKYMKITETNNTILSLIDTLDKERQDLIHHIGEIKSRSAKLRSENQLFDAVITKLNNTNKRNNGSEKEIAKQGRSKKCKCKKTNTMNQVISSLRVKACKSDNFLNGKNMLINDIENTCQNTHNVHDWQNLYTKSHFIGKTRNVHEGLKVSNSSKKSVGYPNITL